MIWPLDSSFKKKISLAPEFFRNSPLVLDLLDE